ncbi:MAG: response regulator transcription factor [Clostridia bacterium]|nr:response regulator transcription factor [Clostridia bacterium]
MFKILVVEDDKNISQLMKTYLVKDGYDVILAKDGVDALEQMERTHIDLAITDLMMPNMDGFEFTQAVREISPIPVLMVTAKEELVDKKKGFQAGADDYMVKPIDLDEMLLRVSALLRRAMMANEKVIRIGNTTVDYNSLSVTANNYSIELTKKEFQLLFKLLSSPNRIFTRAQLMDDIWGYDSESDERTVDVHIRRIREKLEDFTDDFEVVTVRGLGYKAVIHSD